MSKGEIVIDETRCKGCGYCVHFCSRNSIVITGERFGPLGYAIPEVAPGSQCTGCGICNWLCPDQAIEVYRLVEKEASR